MSTNPPSQTIYLRNLNEKVRKDELKMSLYALFSAYGRIQDVVALKTMKMRGQAFVCFEEITSATAAIRGLQGFHFYDKPMEIQYSKTKSNVIKRMNGVYDDSLRKRDREDDDEDSNPMKFRETL
ncbi:RNA-binding domain-containing protein [Basidiobolus meristosporus CBS 931.73]|uniref:RNA-binding domain-containing protein n=1 Tax=Basidiobolus meristosporus CBS 931.73 TaxID=1314790 RepID=A0A1Y1XIP8_9FUNG|nr:RNA-binding domain-containing protein [Basidiobolus meristosporus CBS 931.73]|eukprot:ORX85641.1 RNA-binding domain-containing protein [Basidiobolus meristosporus CBS 931.73]